MSVLSLKTFFKTASLIVFWFVCLCQNVVGCTDYPVYLSKFDNTEYVFIGQVVGYTEPVRFNCEIKAFEQRSFEYQAAYGLKVKLKETVHLPKTPSNYFEIFPLLSDGGCTKIGLYQKELEKRFPLNSEFFVITKEAQLFAQIPEDGIVRLESNSPISNIIGLNRGPGETKLTNAVSVFDFSQFKVDLEPKNNLYNLKLFDFEARKELLRLQNAKTLKEKEVIIKRLLELPTRVIDSYNILKNNLRNRTEILSIYEKRLRFENEIKRTILKVPPIPEDKIQELLQKARLDLQKNRRARKNKPK